MGPQPLIYEGSCIISTISFYACSVCNLAPLLGVWGWGEGEGMKEKGWGGVGACSEVNILCSNCLTEHVSGHHFFFFLNTRVTGILMIH